MRALTRKLLRDLRHMRSQAIAIALVLACGVAMYVAYFSTFDSLHQTVANYYADNRFADLFAGCKRAPRSLLDRIRSIDGVAQANVRVVVDVTADLPGVTEPMTARLISMTFPREPVLNDIFLRRGREPDPARPDEVLVSESFAKGRHLDLGDRVGAVINGHHRDLQIVGIALSPEYVYALRSGDLLPDPARVGMFWMEERALGAAYNMEGGFNDVAVRLAPGASEQDVAAALDRVLEPYGSFGTVPQRLQTSSWFLNNELRNLQTAGVYVPSIFLLVAAFLLNVSLNRIIAVQREQIAALKAVGYTNVELGLHYAGFSLVISLAGALAAVGIGKWLGVGMIEMYNRIFNFPTLVHHVSPVFVVRAIGIGAVAGLAGALTAVRHVVNLAPAEAMRPPAPERHRQTLIERMGLQRHMPPALRMILRNTASQPIRTSLAILGVSLAVAILVIGLFFIDAINGLLHIQFDVTQRQDVTLAFTEPVSADAAFELERLPGVTQVEASRIVPVEIRHGYISRRAAVSGLEPDPALNRVVGASLDPVALAPEGVVLSQTLGEVLGVRAGDIVELRVLEGTRPIRTVTVQRLVDDYMGANAYMTLGALHALMREAGSLSGAYLRIDPALETALYRDLKTTPMVAGVLLKRAMVQSFKDTIMQNMMTMIVINVVFACLIAYGVVYNASRIILSERGRDLASLRVLGFTRREVSGILLGELAVIVVLALPVGILIGQSLSALLTWAMSSELYRFPLIITPRTRLFAVVVVLLAAVVSGLIVRRRVDHLDLVAVLKVRE
ncbi:MAG TPA: FtsX-like permease family protein [Vicinamibacterales bacterium]|nr:FtsX-like permease family protein [Vicinamibacterales bacterium]